MGLDVFCILPKTSEDNNTLYIKKLLYVFNNSELFFSSFLKVLNERSGSSSNFEFDPSNKLDTTEESIWTKQGIIVFNKKSSLEVLFPLRLRFVSDEYYANEIGKVADKLLEYFNLSYCYVTFDCNLNYAIYDKGYVFDLEKLKSAKYLEEISDLARIDGMYFNEAMLKETVVKHELVR